MRKRPVGRLALASEVGKNRPVAVRFGWGGANAVNGHFCAVVGLFGAMLSRVEIADPGYGMTIVPYATLRSRYRGSGAWSTTYMTR